MVDAPKILADADGGGKSIVRHITGEQADGIRVL